jgi:hypothetical protein
MSTSLRSANLLVAVIFIITAACTINVAGRQHLLLSLALWIVALLQALIAIGPLRSAVAGTTPPTGGKR